MNCKGLHLSRRCVFVCNDFALVDGLLQRLGAVAAHGNGVCSSSLLQLLFVSPLIVRRFCVSGYWNDPCFRVLERSVLPCAGTIRVSVYWNGPCCRLLQRIVFPFVAMIRVAAYCNSLCLFLLLIAAAVHRSVAGGKTQPNKHAYIHPTPTHETNTRTHTCTRTRNSPTQS